MQKKSPREEETHDQQIQIIAQTKNWIKTIVIGCNFCPFAAKEVKQDSIHYQVEMGTTINACKDALVREFIRLDNDNSIGTTLLILPNIFSGFNNYLDYVALSESILRKKGYTGKYQLASFHPLYQFAGTAVEDVVNYTNKSIYPMLHLLREDRISEALLRYPDPEGIPQRNINFARQKGSAYMKMLRDDCF
jgi:hypothetical protein